jgi:hypothetical protein
MTPQDLLAFLRRHSLAVEATVSPDSRPQAAVVGFVVSDAFEFFFDTLATTDKARNLSVNPATALVIGWDDEQTAQCRGIADEPREAELAFLQRLYFERFPDGPERLNWPGIRYWRVRANWIRYSDFRPKPDGVPPAIVEFDAASLQPKANRAP